MKHSQFIKEAISESRKSSFHKQLAAIVVNRSKIVGRGCNFAHSLGIPRGDGQHAELVALNNTTARFRKGATVYVTHTKDDIIKMAKPCKACQSVMKKMGVKYAWYSNSTGAWHRMEL